MEVKWQRPRISNNSNHYYNKVRHIKPHHHCYHHRHQHTHYHHHHFHTQIRTLEPTHTLVLRISINSHISIRIHLLPTHIHTPLPLTHIHHPIHFQLISLL